MTNANESAARTEYVIRERVALSQLHQEKIRSLWSNATPRRINVRSPLFGMGLVEGYTIVGPRGGERRFHRLTAAGRVVLSRIYDEAEGVDGNGRHIITVATLPAGVEDGARCDAFGAPLTAFLSMDQLESRADDLNGNGIELYAGERAAIMAAIENRQAFDRSERERAAADVGPDAVVYELAAAIAADHADALREERAARAIAAEIALAAHMDATARLAALAAAETDEDEDETDDDDVCENCGAEFDVYSCGECRKCLDCGQRETVPGGRDRAGILPTVDRSEPAPSVPYDLAAALASRDFVAIEAAIAYAEAYDAPAPWREQAAVIRLAAAVRPWHGLTEQAGTIPAIDTNTMTAPDALPEPRHMAAGLAVIDAPSYRAGWRRRLSLAMPIVLAVVAMVSTACTSTTAPDAAVHPCDGVTITAPLPPSGVPASVCGLTGQWIGQAAPFARLRLVLGANADGSTYGTAYAVLADCHSAQPLDCSLMGDVSAAAPIGDAVALTLAFPAYHFTATIAGHARGDVLTGTLTEQLLTNVSAPVAITLDRSPVRMHASDAVDRRAGR